MSYRANPLSALGRISYTTHLLAYPSFLVAYLFGVKPYLAKKAVEDKKKEWDSLPKKRLIDPDLFNPFTPIPYHNNPELKYAFANIKLYGYTNKNHLNVNDYVWRDYHNSFDHNHKNEYLYNWVS